MNEPKFIVRPREIEEICFRCSTKSFCPATEATIVKNGTDHLALGNQTSIDFVIARQIYKSKTERRPSLCHCIIAAFAVPYVVMCVSRGGATYQGP